MRFNGFIGPSYTIDSRAVDAQRCVNLFPQINELGTGKNGESMCLVGTPGLRKLLTIGNGPTRGSYKASDNSYYLVSGSKLYRINSNYEAREIGELQTSTGQVDFADNGTLLVLVDGANGYYHTLGSFTLTQIISSGWRGSNKVEFIDGYFLFADPDTGVFYISGLYSIGLDELDFASAEGSPDNIVTPFVNHREVWLFGSDSIEVWYNSGNPDFPFERASGGFIEYGCAAPFSVAKIGKVNFWLGKDSQGEGIVYAAQGLSPERISTHAVEKAIQSYGDISDAKAWTYQENGHLFYVLNFTSADTTWVFDLNTKLWHERAYWSNGAYSRHRADNHAFVFNKHLVGDYQNGNLYELDSDYFTDNEQEIRRMRVSPHISNSMNRVQYHSFQLDAEVGIGLAGGSQGSEPKAMLQFSNDGGYTWSNELTANLGKQGERKTRTIWRRLGISRDRVFKISISDPVKVILIGAELEMEALAS